LSHPFADELSFALTISEEVEKLAMSYFNKGIEVIEKSDGSPVTRADKEIERFIRESLARQFSGDAILGEEEGPTDGASAESTGRTWIIDPIDGTYNYARGIPIWSTLLALEVDGEIVMGMIVAPAMHELFYAVKGQGTFKNYLPVKVSNIDRLDKAMINFGGPDRIINHGLWPQLTEAIGATEKQRGFGDYLGFSLVFEGKSEAMLEVGVKPWDLACMKILVEEAGGAFFDLSGGNSVHTGSCMVTNRHLMPEFKRIFVK
jgi:histidinol-phosphatase